VLDDELTVFLELFAHEALFELFEVLVEDLGLVELPAHLHVLAAALHVAVEVEARSVCVTHALDPAVTGEDLGVPAVAGLVRHLSVQVLAEPDVFLADPDFLQEQLGLDHELGQRAVADQPVFHGLCHVLHFGFRVGQLECLALQGQLHIAEQVLLFVVFVSGVHEPLDFSHRELSDPQEAVPGCNLVSVPVADLGHSKRQFTVVEVLHALEVDEDALRRLWPHERLGVGVGAYLGFEHQVEVSDFRQGVVVRRQDLVLCDGVLQLRDRHRACCDQSHVQLGFGEVFEQFGFVVFDEFFDEFVCAVRGVVDHVADQGVAEFVHVTGCFEHGVRGQSGAVDFLDVVVDQEVFAPLGLDVVEHGSGHGAQVVETRLSSINGERRNNNVSAF